MTNCRYCQMNKILQLLDESQAYENMALVIWLDSCEPASNADLFIDDLPEPQMIYSLGFILRSEDRFITIAGNHKPPTEGKDDHSWDYVTTIPKCSIQSIHHMEDPREQELQDN